MLDLPHNLAPVFTKIAVQSGLLPSFVLIDVGVQGGVHPRWRYLGHALRVYGFDALEEVVGQLQAEQRTGHSYHPLVIGAADEDREFFVAKNSTGSSLSPRDDGLEKRIVKGRRLDTLLAERVITQPDFIKIDVEGHEAEVLAGASSVLKKVLGVEAETSFDRSPDMPKGHLAALIDILAPHGLFLRDISIDRTPNRIFLERAGQLGVRLPAVQSPGTINALFSRAIPANQDEAIKLATILEIYGLTDLAYILLLNCLPKMADLVIRHRPWNIVRHNTLRTAFDDFRGAALRSVAVRLNRLFSEP